MPIGKGNAAYYLKPFEIIQHNISKERIFYPPASAYKLRTFILDVLRNLLNAVPTEDIVLRHHAIYVNILILDWYFS